MKHMLAGDNVGLITTRQVAVSIFNHSLITNSIIDNRLTRSNKGICYLFPLYLYPHGDSLDVKSTSWREGENGRIPNLNRKLIEGIAKRLGVIFISEGKGNIIQTPLPCTAGRPPSKRGGKGPPFEGGRIRFWRIRGVDNRSRGHPQLHLRHPPQPNLPHPLRTIPEDGLPPCALHLQPGAVCQTLSHRLKTYQPASA